MYLKYILHLVSLFAAVRRNYLDKAGHANGTLHTIIKKMLFD